MQRAEFDTNPRNFWQFLALKPQKADSWEIQVSRISFIFTPFEPRGERVAGFQFQQASPRHCGDMMAGSLSKKLPRIQSVRSGQKVIPMDWIRADQGCNRQITGQQRVGLMMLLGVGRGSQQKAHFAAVETVWCSACGSAWKL